MPDLPNQKPDFKPAPPVSSGEPLPVDQGSPLPPPGKPVGEERPPLSAATGPQSEPVRPVWMDPPQKSSDPLDETSQKLPDSSRPDAADPIPSAWVGLSPPSSPEPAPDEPVSGLPGFKQPSDQGESPPPPSTKPARPVWMDPPSEKPESGPPVSPEPENIPPEALTDARTEPEPQPPEKSASLTEPAVSPSLETPQPIASDRTTTPPAKPPSGSKLKKLLPLAILLVAILALAGVVFRFVLPRFQVAQKPAELTYWGLWEPENVMREIIADWEGQHPNIKVKYEQHSPREYRERLQSALARGNGPDIFRFHNTWAPMLKNDLDQVPASVMDASTYERTFYPVAAKSLRVGAGYVGVPMEIDTLALFYNQDIFTAAGVTVPKTWDELRELALRLALKDQEGHLQRGGVALGTTGNIWHWSDILGLMMFQNGADPARPTGQLAEDALAFYTIFANTDEVWDESMPTSIFAFATGKVAMAFGFSWDVFEIQNINPGLNFKVAPMPQLSGTDLAWASFWVEGVSQKSANRQAAWEFVKFLTSKESLEKLYQAESRLRLFGEPYARVEMAGLLQTDSMVAPFINQASKAQSWYLCSRTFDNGINDRIIKYYEDAVNAVNAGTAPADALSTASQGISQVLSQYGLSADGR